MCKKSTQAKPFSSQKVLPLGAAQQGIYLGQALNPNSALYNAAECVEVNGTFQRDYFLQALRHVINAADVLHTTYSPVAETNAVETTSNSVHQNVNAPDWQLIELDFSNSASAWSDAQQWMQKDLATVVNLQQGPIFQQALIVLSPTRHLWYQRIHHVACDGYAFALIAQKVAQLYQLLLDKSPIPEDVFGNYEKVIAADEQYTTSKKYQQDQQFWLQALNAELNPITVKPIASVTALPIHNRSELPLSLFERVQHLAVQRGCPWSDVIYAACAQWLAFKTAAPKVTLGLPVMVRMGTPAVRVPSMVMNINPLPIDFKRCQHFDDVLNQVCEFQKVARRHQKYRYEHLRRDVGAVGGNKRLFGPVVNVMPFDRALKFGEASAQVHAISAGPVEDLSLAFALTEKGTLTLNIEANPSCYTQDDLQGYKNEINNILLASVNTPHQPLAIDFSRASFVQSPPLKKPLMSVIKALSVQANKTPSAIAIEDGSAALTYKELMQAINAMAYQLSIHKDYLRVDENYLGSASREESVHAQSLNVKNSTIALYCTRSMDAIIASLAVLKVGSAYVFLDPKGPLIRNEQILKDANPTLIVEDEPLPLGGAWPRVSLAALRSEDTNLESGIKNVGVKAHQDEGPAYLIYTSGSTGKPKGVIVGHDALAAFVSSAAKQYGITSNDRVLQFAPLHFDASVEEIYLSLCTGATLVLRNESMLSSMPEFLKTVAQWNISVLDLPTAFWHEWVLFCANTQAALPRCIHTVIIGGEAVQPERVSQWHALAHAHAGENNNPSGIRLLNTYGPSETTVVATFADLQPGKDVTIGKPLMGRAIAVVNAQQQLVAKGEPGQLAILGDGLGLGYHNLPEQTQANFVTLSCLYWGEFYNAAPRAYLTGDRVTLDENEQLHFLGRIDDEIKISGYRVHPLEVEAALLKITDIEQAAVVVFKRNLYAFVTLYGAAASPPKATKSTANVEMDVNNHSSNNHSSNNSSSNNNGSNKHNLRGAEIRQQLSATLPAPMVPAGVECLSDMPKNAAGKVDKKLLVQRLESGLTVGADASVAVLSVTEQKISEVWQSVLGVSNIGTEDDFFLLGGQSLQTIQVASRLSVLFKKNIDVTTLFEFPTLGALALAVDNNVANANAVQALSEGEKPHEQMQEQLQRDSLLNLQHFPGIHSYQLGEVKSVLLTGATGFVGAQLLHALLRENITVYCLVRADSYPHGLARIRSAFVKQRLPQTFLMHGLHVVLGDASKSNFGLDNTEYLALTNTVDAVLHNAANTSVMRDYQSLRPANLEATLNAFSFSVTAKAPLHFVSTIAVAPKEGLPEDFVAWHKGLKDGYQQSKWAAENLLAQAHERGYPVSVYRLGRVTGAAQTGFVNPQDLAWRMINASVVVEAYPNIPLAEPWAPVDDLANIICKNVLQQGLWGVLNPVPKQNVSLLNIFHWLQEYGLKLTKTEFTDWVSLLDAKNNDACKALAGFFQQRKNAGGELHLPTVITEKTDAFMAACHVQFRPLTQRLFYKYLDYAIHNNVIDVVPNAAGVDIKALNRRDINEVTKKHTEEQPLTTESEGA